MVLALEGIGSTDGAGPYTAGGGLSDLRWGAVTRFTGGISRDEGPIRSRLYGWPKHSCLERFMTSLVGSMDTRNWPPG